MLDHILIHCHLNLRDYLPDYKKTPSFSINRLDSYQSKQLYMGMTGLAQSEGNRHARDPRNRSNQSIEPIDSSPSKVDLTDMSLVDDQVDCQSLNS
jgi:hypothetical protein